MNIYGLVALFNSVTLFLLSLLILKQNLNNAASRNLGYFVLSISVWSLFYFAWQAAPNSTAASFFFDLLMAWVILVPVFYFRFILFFLGSFSRWRPDLIVSYFLCAFLLIANQFSLVTSGIKEKSLYINYAPIAGPLFIAIIAYYVGTIIYSFILLGHAYRLQSPIKKQQIIYTMGATIFAYLVNLTNYFPWFDINFPPIGNFLMAFVIVGIAYAFITRHLADLKFVFRKTTIQLINFSVLLFFVFFFEFLFYALFPRQELWLDIVVITSAISLYPGLKTTINRFANRYFATTFYDPAEILSRISERFSTTLKVDAILDLVVGTATAAFRTVAISLYSYDDKNNRMVEYSNFGFAKELGDIELTPALAKYFFNKSLPIIIDEYSVKQPQAKKFHTFIQAADVEVFMPMTVGDKIIGAVLLGRKASDDLYTDDDLKFFNAVCSQAAMALANAKLYEEIKDFNRTLETKVHEQTKDIQAKNEHLEKLLALRSEFLDIASHQLRTPVSVIKGVLSMIDEGSIPKNKEKQFLRGAIEKSIKLGEIINDLLRASEMDSDKFELKIEPVSLDDVFKKIKEDKSVAALPSEVDLKFDLPTEPLPPVMGDERYIEHAIVNLVNNALQYTRSGHVRIWTAVEGGHLAIRVEDTGIGIPAEDVPNLFEKFRRGGNAVETYADGSGLGLFIVKKIIDAIPGSSIQVEKTELDHGTTMLLKLPLENIS